METPATAFCNQAFDLLDRMRAFSGSAVLPAIAGLKAENSRTNRRQDATVYEAYARMGMWMKSITQLKATSDVQAIGTGARCLFEHLLDLKWLELNPGPEWLEKFNAFSRVDRYNSARKTLRYINENKKSQICADQFRRLIADLDKRESVKAAVCRIWGRDGNNEPKWPKHWTGEANILTRSERMGTRFVDIYRGAYSGLSWLVHSGPSAFHGRGFDEIERCVGAGYIYAFDFSHEGTRLACDILGIAGTIPDFESTMAELMKWRSAVQLSLL